MTPAPNRGAGSGQRLLLSVRLLIGIILVIRVLLGLRPARDRMIAQQAAAEQMAAAAAAEAAAARTSTRLGRLPTARPRLVVVPEVEAEEPAPEPTPVVRALRIVGGVAAAVVTAAMLLTLPLLAVKSHATAAADDLVHIQTALSDDDLAAAQDDVEDARRHVGRAESGTDSVLVGLWRRLPVVGSAIDDVGHLLAALDDATTIAEAGVALYPAVTGEDATLIVDKQVDMPTLNRVITAVNNAGVRLESARKSLAQVQGTNARLGPAIIEARDTALEQIDTAQSALAEYQPLVDVLPTLLGAEEQQNYLIAMLNPAELRYSGGATLALTRLTTDEGHINLSNGDDLDQLSVAVGPIDWEAVPGNIFHKPEPQILSNATFAPDWYVSGEELLRGLQVATGENYDGLIAVDVITLAKMLAVTGPVEVPGYGELTKDNLVETLVGSYDKYNNPGLRHELNLAIIPAFKEKLFDRISVKEKFEAINDAAQGRHFAVYFRQQELQDAFQSLDLVGNLSSTNGDYIGVFTQNINGSKVDYFQKRTVTSKVRLYQDGSAIVTKRVRIYNDTGKYVQEGEDPGFGYYTKYARMDVGQFLPKGATILRATYRDQPFDPAEFLSQYYDRPYLHKIAWIDPQGVYTIQLTYRVPQAALVGEDGSLTYLLDVDPQGLATPAELTVTVQWPDGYSVGDLPEGWVGSANTAMFTTPALDSSPRWAITATKGAVTP